ncbi:MAG TPA: hypothetical protein VGK87_06470 [Anaerolineae bacterium]
MVELKLLSNTQRPIRPIVENALANELRLQEAGIERTELRLRELESRYHMTTSEFIRAFEDNELGETLEFAEWVGEYRLLLRQREKADTLRGIQFAG